MTERLDHGELAAYGDGFGVSAVFVDDSQHIILGAGTYTKTGDNSYTYSIGLGVIGGSNILYRPVRKLLAENPGGANLTRSNWGYSYTGSDNPIDKSKDWIAYHDIVQPDGSVITEIPAAVHQDGSSSCGMDKVIVNQHGQLYTRLIFEGGDYPGARVSLLIKRVDPRNMP